MFYSHEILTSRKYGVATVWLVATLGSRSNLKKVNRKAILDVNVPKTCETIIAPEAPMALRLQGNLLYGVSRVYMQQCGYVLADAEHAHSSILAIRKLMRASDIDARAGRARPEQLTLPDDPAFLPELALPALDPSLLLDDFPSLLSVYPSTPRGLLPQAGRLPGAIERAPLGLVIPTSEGDGAHGLAMGGLDISSGSGDIDDVYHGRSEGEEEGLLPEVGFEFDAEGNLRSVVASDNAPPITAAARPARVRDSSASARVRQEHAEGLRARRALGEPMVGGEDTGMEMEYDLPEALPFSPRTIAAQAAELLAGSQSPQALETEGPLPATDAPPVRRQRAPRFIEPDDTTELPRNVIAGWNSEYANNMASVDRSKRSHRVPAVAKKNASFWVFGAGISEIGLGVGQSHLSGALNMFSGDALMELLKRTDTPETPRKRKTPSDEQPDPESAERRVRARNEEEEEQVGRGDEPMDLDEGGAIRGFDDDDIEIGREAARELQDQSSAMPWNISASVRGSRPASSIRPRRGRLTAGVPTSMARPSSFYGPDPHLPSRRVSRITSASPLIGRGRPSGAEPISSDDTADEGAFLGGLELDDPAAMGEFELPPPPPPPTTTAPAPDALKPRRPTTQMLEPDTFNFLEYLQSNLEDVQQQGRVTGVEGAAEPPTDQGPPRDYVVFEELLDPARYSKAVAAQAFHHTLVLATRNIITVRQSTDYGEIEITPVTTA